MLSEIIIRVLKGDPYHDEKGRFTSKENAGAADSSDTGRFLASLPLDKKPVGAQKKELLKRYKTEPEFHDFADAASRFTAGHFTFMQRATTADLAGQTDAWKSAEEKLRQIPGQPSPGNFLELLGLSKIKALDGSDLASGKVVTTDSALQDGKALMKAVRDSPETEGDLWRGVLGRAKFDSYEEYQKDYDFLPKEELMPHVLYDMQTRGRNIADLKPGDTYEMPAPVSFTRSEELGRKFAAGRASGQLKGGKVTEATLIHIIGPKKAANVSAFSPFNQQESVTQGKFEVVSNEFKEGWGEPDLHTLTLKQVGVF